VGSAGAVVVLQRQRQCRPLSFSGSFASGQPPLPSGRSRIDDRSKGKKQIHLKMGGKPGSGGIPGPQHRPAQRARGDISAREYEDRKKKHQNSRAAGKPGKPGDARRRKPRLVSRGGLAEAAGGTPGVDELAGVMSAKGGQFSRGEGPQWEGRSLTAAGSASRARSGDSLGGVPGAARPGGGAREFKSERRDS